MRIVRREWKKPLALWCALTLCLLPCLASASAMGPSEPVKPGQLLRARLAQALDAGRRLDATFRMGLERMNPTLGAPAEELEAARQLLDAAELRAGFGMAGDNMEIDLAIVLAGQEVVFGKVHVLGEGLALETNLLPGKVAMFPYEKIMEALEQNGISFDGPFFDMDEETMAVLMKAAGEYGAILMAWGEEIAANNIEITTDSIPATDTRDASAMQAKTRAGDDDFQQVLLAVASRFVTDAELQRALSNLTGASERDVAWIGYEFIRKLNESPLRGNQLNVDMYANESGELVGIDYLQLVPMDDDALGIALNYGHKNRDAASTDSLRVDIGAHSGGGFTLDASYTADESVPNALTEAYALRMRVKSGTPYYSPDSVAMDGTMRRQIESAPAAETIKDEAAFTAKAAGMETAVRVTYDASTEALEQDDFRAAGRMVMEMGMADMDIAAINMDWTLASSAFALAGVEGKTIIDPFALTETELEALAEEMKIQLMQAGFAAAGKLPAPTLQLIMDLGGMTF